MKNTLHMDTMLVGLIGHPIKQTYSPFIHNVAFDLKKVDYLYLPFDVPAANLGNAVKGMVALGIKGFNVTIPHKVNIMQLMNNISDEAAGVGAVNTVVNDLGRLSGYNTDVYGILKTLDKHKSILAGKEMTVAGAGGSARAVIYTLIKYFKPAQINIINRTEQKAEALKKYFSDKMKFEAIKCYELLSSDLVDVFQRSELIVNATPIGMYPETDDAVISLEKAFNKEQIVFDLVYNPSKTRLLSIASKQGAKVINGTEMLVNQASKAFELWTGEIMPVPDIIRSLEMMIDT
ncbi:MAG TPA: shikimate dehydrogenase [Ignavibacteriaceae bacterium]|nr:shikimate dehydrogenase [Ignavibacteriaceae bacterium]